MRRPTDEQVTRAAEVLGRAATMEARRIRDEQGHAGHVQAQELEHAAIRVSGLASQINAIRRNGR